MPKQAKDLDGKPFSDFTAKTGEYNKFAEQVKLKAKGKTCGDCQHNMRGLCYLHMIEIHNDWAIACAEYKKLRRKRKR